MEIELIIMVTHGNKELQHERGTSENVNNSLHFTRYFTNLIFIYIVWNTFVIYFMQFLVIYCVQFSVIYCVQFSVIYFVQLYR